MTDEGLGGVVRWIEVRLVFFEVLSEPNKTSSKFNFFYKRFECRVLTPSINNPQFHTHKSKSISHSISKTDFQICSFECFNRNHQKDTQQNIIFSVTLISFRNQKNIWKKKRFNICKLIRSVSVRKRNNFQVNNFNFFVKKQNEIILWQI